MKRVCAIKISYLYGVGTLASIKHARTLSVPHLVSQSACVIIILITLLCQLYVTSLLIFYDTTKFPQNDEACRLGPIHQSTQEVVGRAGHKVLMKVYDNTALIVGDPHGVLGQQLRPHQSVNYILLLIN